MYICYCVVDRTYNLVSEISHMDPQLKQVNEKCDVYAFGGIMTELFGERPLWQQETPPFISTSIQFIDHQFSTVNYQFP